MKGNVVKNTIYLYGLSIAKIVFPLLTLPYLTRVLSTDYYGVVAYVKSVMQYMQIIIDFGFMLSGTRDIVLERDDKNKIGFVAGDVLGARLLLSFLSFFALIILSFSIPLLRANITYTLLSFVSVFLSIFLFDYIFRGIEKMEVITLRFIVMKGIATVLTFVLVHNDFDVMWIPVLDIAGSLVAVILVALQLRKLGIHIKVTSIKSSVKKLTQSATYFASNMATTAFGALNTVLIGIFMSSSDVAFWSVCMQIVGAIQTMYTPITDGIYPEMVKQKSLALIGRVIKFVLPVVIVGCGLTVFLAQYALLIVGGAKYTEAAPLLRFLVPVLLFSFLAMLFGWPTMGAIGRAKEVTITTFVTALFQIIGLLLLALANRFYLIPLAILRGVTEFVLFIQRFCLTLRYKNEFENENNET